MVRSWFGVLTSCGSQAAQATAIAASEAAFLLGLNHGRLQQCAAAVCGSRASARPGRRRTVSCTSDCNSMLSKRKGSSNCVVSVLYSS